MYFTKYPILITVLTLCLCKSIHAQSWQDYNNASLDYYSTNNLDSAIQYSLYAISATIEDSNRATSFNNLGYLYAQQANYSLSEQYYTKALNSREKIFGEQSNRYLETAFNLSGMYFNSGEYGKMIDLSKIIRTIISEKSGKKSFDYYKILNQLATAYYFAGNYPNADEIYQEALEIGESIIGKNNQYYAENLNSLGIIKFSFGNYDKAEEYFKNAFEIRNQIFGNDHLLCAQSLMNLAMVNAEKAKFQLAEEQYIACGTTILNKLGDNHPEYAKLLNNLGELYRKFGMYEKAETYYDNAIQICESSDDFYKTELVKYKNNLAILFGQTNRYADSEKLRLEVLEIMSETYGNNHPDYATAINNVAVLQIKQEKYTDAKKNIKDAIQIWESQYGNEYKSIWKAKINLAQIYIKTNKRKEAINLLNIIKENWEKLYGTNHPEYSEILFSYALAQHTEHEANMTNSAYFDLFEHLYAQIDHNFAFLSEKEKSQYIDQLTIKFDNYYEVICSNKMKSPDGMGIAYNNALRLKNLLLRTSNTMRNSLLSSNDSLIITHFNKWLSVKNHLAYLYSLPKTNKNDSDIFAYENYSNSYEKELNKASLEFNEQTHFYDWESIQKQLKKDEVAIEFIHFNTSGGAVKYCALMIKKDFKNPDIIELFKEKDLLELIPENKNSYDYVSRLYGTKAKPDTSLYKLIWAPLKKYLKNTKTIYYAPSGLLHKISFASIVNNENQYLSETYQLFPLTTTAKILKNNNDSKLSPENKTHIFGGIKYDNSEGEEYGWKYLPGSQQEADEITKLLEENNYPVTISEGLLATERAFKSACYNKYGIIHIATHGFFYEPFVEIKKTQMAEHGNIDFRANRNTKISEYVQNNDPLMRSGLVFAGANNIFNENLKNTNNDGILTAYEVSNMSLKDEKLVILSACETGLGAIQGAEGIYGLQRAFKMAGVSMLIMSLWEIPDKETKEFMIKFYQQMISGQPIKTAFIETQREMQRKYDSYFWGAFVLTE